MLRIALHQDGNQCRLELSCKLYAPWVGETETVWRSAACSGERIEVDLRDVTGVDDAGSQLLAAMHEEGAGFAAQGLAMTALIDEITGKQTFSIRQRRRKFSRTRFRDQESN
jgi:hypothetical protein